MDTNVPDVTELLVRAADGADDALDAVFERVYPQLRGLAHRVRNGRNGETLNTTALANEAYLKLAGGRTVDWNGRAHFFAVAARAMRQILVDRARRSGAAKRGGGLAEVSLAEGMLAAPIRADELLELDRALDRLASFEPRRAAVVEHRYFAGLTTEETAVVLGVSTATVERDWRAARAWLAVHLGVEGNAS